MNPFPSDGDASKIAEFTDFMVCLHRERQDGFRKILLPLLERANLGSVEGLHDIILVGEIGRGKTHLLKFIQKKLSGKKTIFVSDGLDFPNYSNILPVYVKLDASVISSTNHFIYFFLNYILGTIPKDFGLLNCLDDDVKNTLSSEVEKIYQSIMGQNISVPSVISIQRAFRILYDVSERAMQLTGKKSILFMLDEMEGVVLTAEKREDTMRLVMDFLRQLHDQINKESSSSIPIFCFYAMTAPAYHQASRARESTAWLSRLRTNTLEIPRMSDEELSALVSTALKNPDLEDISPFTENALSFIFRSVTGQPRYAIMAISNAYGSFLRLGLNEIETKDVYSSTDWLDPKEVIDRQKVNRLTASIGSRYGYLVSYFSDSIGSYSLSLKQAILDSKQYYQGSITRDRITSDIVKLRDMGYIEYEEEDEEETIRVSQFFYGKILKELTREIEPGDTPFRPLSLITITANDIVSRIRANGYTQNNRIKMLSYSLIHVLEQLFMEEGISRAEISDGCYLFTTRKSKRGSEFNLLVKIIVNEVVDPSLLLGILKENDVDLILFLYDYEDQFNERKNLSILKETLIPSENDWIYKIFSRSIQEELKGVPALNGISNVLKSKTINEMSLFYPVSVGTKQYRSSEVGNKTINIKGLWYSLTEIYDAHKVDPEYAQAIDAQYKHLYQEFFGDIRTKLLALHANVSKDIVDIFKITKNMIKHINTLLTDERIKTAIIEKGLFETPLPSNINSRNVNAIANSTGLISIIDPTTWRVNSFQIAGRNNPWIYLWLKVYTGQLPDDYVSSLLKENLSGNEVEVKNCLDFYNELLVLMEYVKDGIISIADNKTKLLNAIKTMEQKINLLNSKEFKGDKETLNYYVNKMTIIRGGIDETENKQLHEWEADDIFSGNLDEIKLCDNQIDELVRNINRIANEKNKLIESLYQNMLDSQKKAESVFFDFNLNESTSKINTLVFDDPSVLDYVLQFKVDVNPPILDLNIEEKMKDYKKSYESLWLSDSIFKIEELEELLNKKINQNNSVEKKYKAEISNYISNVRDYYHKLQSLPDTFELKQNKVINDSLDESRDILSTDLLRSLICVATSNKNLHDDATQLTGLVRLRLSEIKNNLMKEIANSKLFINSSMTLIEKTNGKKNLKQYKQIIADINIIDKNVDTYEQFNLSSSFNIHDATFINEFEKIIKQKIQEQRITYDRISTIKTKIMELNEIFSNNEFSIALKFLSDNDVIKYDNYHTFIEKIGDESTANEILLNLLKLGLLSVKGEQ